MLHSLLAGGLGAAAAFRPPADDARQGARLNARMPSAAANNPPALRILKASSARHCAEGNPAALPPGVA